MMTQTTKAQKVNPLEEILNHHPALFKNILNHPQKNEVQIIYTQINRDKNNQASFKTYNYNLDNHHYFYPASTIKLPAAIFALEKINDLNIEGLNKDTPLNIEASFGNQTQVNEDKSAVNGLPSIANYIKKILLVSDNDAFNRIYEFTNRAEINQKLKKYGFKNSRIVNRLAVGDKGENARNTNSVSFLNDKKNVFYTKPSAYDAHNYPLKLNGLLKGKGYLNGKDILINKPFDFTDFNTFQLTDQHELMKRLFFSENYAGKKRFNLTETDYDFLYRYMSMYPTESLTPNYPLSSAYFPSYCKFLFYGADIKKPIQPNIRIFNKVGDAYGYAIDNIYFIDFENKIEFILSAVIQSNKNGIYNDNLYEYDSVCFPFMKNLGEKVYEFELKRAKKFEPDFSKFLKYK